MPSTATTPTRPRQGGLSRFGPLLLDVGLPLAVFYGLRLTDLSLSWCYAAGALAGAAVVGATAIRRRKLDGIGTVVLAGFAIQLVVSLITGDIKLAALTDSVISGVIGTAMLISLSGRLPAFQLIALRLAGTTPESRTLIETRWETLAGYRRLMRTLTAVCGVVLITAALIRALLVVVLGPDAVVGAFWALQLVTVAGLLGWVFWYAKRKASGWSPPAC